MERTQLLKNIGPSVAFVRRVPVSRIRGPAKMQIQTRQQSGGNGATLTPYSPSHRCRENMEYAIRIDAVCWNSCR
ncbi:MAG: hypothetical protein P8127_17815, partial [Acidobacteriota bacterium]